MIENGRGLQLEGPLLALGVRSRPADPGDQAVLGRRVWVGSRSGSRGRSRSGSGPEGSEEEGEEESEEEESPEESPESQDESPSREGSPPTLAFTSG